MAPESVVGQGLLGDDHLISTPDGRTLRAMVAGEGEDLVVLEAGLGVSGLYWGPVHAAVAEGARVVAYERAGFGASSPDERPRDLVRLAADLHTVLEAFPHRRLVLVGHSWGGPIARTVAADRLTAGLSLEGVVLVDQSDENSSLYFSAMARLMDAVQIGLMVPLARLRLLGPLSAGLVNGLDEPLRSATISASTSIAAARSAVAELVHVVDGLRGLRSAPADLGELSIHVLSGQRSGTLDAKARAPWCKHTAGLPVSTRRAASSLRRTPAT